MAVRIRVLNEGSGEIHENPKIAYDERFEEFQMLDGGSRTVKGFREDGTR